MGAGDVEVGINTPTGKKAAWFNAVDSEINTSDIDYLNISLCAWIKPRINADRGTIIGKRAGAINSFNFALETNEALKFDIKTAANDDVTGTAAEITLEQWAHVAATFDGTTMIMYINGVESARQIHTNPGDIAAGADTICIGQRTAAADDDVFSGAIGDIRLFNVGLTPAEILLIYQGGRVERGLQSTWDFRNNDYTDAEGNNNGTAADTFIGVFESTVAAAIKAARVGINDHQLLCMTANKQIINVNVEE